ncbi:hypothetical protein D1872_284520 [compost metagenome]
MQDVDDRCGARFLGAAERFVLQGADAARLVAGGRVLVDRLAVGQEVLLEIVDQGDDLLEDFPVLRAGHQHFLGAEHLGHLR